MFEAIPWQVVSQTEVDGWFTGIHALDLCARSVTWQT